MEVRDGKAVLTFRHVGGGLVARGGPLKGFTVAGPDSKYFPAEAEIRGDQVVVSSPHVARPAGVRYGWADYPVINLWNKDGLPAAPFQTSGE
jgi:sialate O-acetylesterase